MHFALGCPSVRICVTLEFSPSTPETHMLTLELESTLFRIDSSCSLLVFFVESTFNFIRLIFAVESTMELTQELSEEAQKLVDQGLSVRVAQRVGSIFATGALLPTELDDRALDALREFNEDGAIEVLDQFGSSDLSHVQNKSAFLCGVMKTYREKNRQKAQGHTPGGEALNGPNEEKIKALLDRTGYTLDITTGQRKYGGPPPNWEGPAPSTGSEVFWFDFSQKLTVLEASFNLMCTHLHE